MKTSRAVRVAITTVGVSALAAALGGCQAGGEPEPVRPAELAGKEDGPVASVAQEITWMACQPGRQLFRFQDWQLKDCAGSSTVTVDTALLKRAKKIANSYFRYILGGPLPPIANLTVPMTGSAYDRNKELKAKLCGIREAIAAGTVTIESRGQVPLDDTCGIPTTEYELKGSVAWDSTSVKAACSKPDMMAYTGVVGVGKVVSDVERLARTVNGWSNGCNNYPTFFRLENGLPDTVARIDPEPAVLNAGMSLSSIGASGGATFKATSEPTTGYRYPSTFTSCSETTGANAAGLPCTSAYASGGSTLTGSVEWNKRTGSSSLCRCVASDVVAGGSSSGWSGASTTGAVARYEEDRFTTVTLGAGTHTFRMTGTGDADLYVKVGSAPTTSSYNCRPYSSGSYESCTVSLGASSVVHLMVRGYASSSSYTIAKQ